MAAPRRRAWRTLRQLRGYPVCGEGVQGIVDQKSRTPESLAKSFALALRAVDHPKMAMAGDAVLVVSPEHSRVFIEAGWTKARLLEELETLLQFPGKK